MIEAGDTLEALAFLEDRLNNLPSPKNADDSTLYGWMYARIDFLYFHVYDSKSITADYYQASYPYLKYLPETTRVDILRWTARTLLLQGDTLSALPYLYESRHRALAIGDSTRIAKADTCISYLMPKEIQITLSLVHFPLKTILLFVFFISTTALISIKLTSRLHRRELPLIFKSS